MDERVRRHWAAAEARELGWGGVSAVGVATGLSRKTIAAGLRELEMPAERRLAEAARVRRPAAADRGGTRFAGGARGPRRAGDPGRPVLAAAVDLQEHAAAGQRADAPGPPGQPADGRCAAERCRLQPPAQPQGAGGQLPPGPRRPVPLHQRLGPPPGPGRGRPAASVDTKKKEPVGDFKNGEREWRPAGRSRCASTTS